MCRLLVVMICFVAVCSCKPPVEGKKQFEGSDLDPKVDINHKSPSVRKEIESLYAFCNHLDSAKSWQLQDTVSQCPEILFDETGHVTRSSYDSLFRYHIYAFNDHGYEAYFYYVVEDQFKLMYCDAITYYHPLAVPGDTSGEMIQIEQSVGEEYFYFVDNEMVYYHTEGDLDETRDVTAYLEAMEKHCLDELGLLNRQFN
jgi:hypothetical protein